MCVVCEPDVMECDDNTSMHCLSDGSAWEELEVCSGLKPACLEETGTCGSCAEGTVQCVGDALRTCQSDQTWGISDSCDSATPQCFDKACHECDPEEGNGRSCDDQTPRVCVDGVWMDEAECDGDMPICSPATGRCACAEGTLRGQYACTGGAGREACVGGVWQPMAECGGWPCVGGNTCYTPPSCEGMVDTQCAGYPCCAQVTLPEINAFPVGEGADSSGYGPEHNVRLSPFSLDKFEVTVGRFRAFMEDFTIPEAGAGQTPHQSDEGWDPAWDVELSTDNFGNCQDNLLTWTEAPGANEEKAMNCLTWPMAYAFCIWDGGRLPTEAEWESAAAGGTEDRPFPWGNSPPTCDLANINSCFGAPETVGLHPGGDSRWGHADMAGNLWEHVRDHMDADFYDSSGADDFNAVNLTVVEGQENRRVVKGGNYSFPESNAQAFSRDDSSFGDTSDHRYSGVRCARAP
jgi:formylglycine-generating enzyme required for sulfatase activity